MFHLPVQASVRRIAIFLVNVAASMVLIAFVGKYPIIGLKSSVVATV